jgi:PII-like signaling protein
LPAPISLIDTEEKIRRALPVLREMIGEGLVAITDVEVLHHISGKRDGKK